MTTNKLQTKQIDFVMKMFENGATTNGKTTLNVTIKI